VAALVGVFREVRRVLRDDGTVWLNLGDSYATSPGANNANLQAWAAENAKGGGRRAGLDPTPRRLVPDGFKPKDLLGIPWLVAFALRADGWYLRSDIIWAKPNPMPESVTDRPTKAHEYLFLLSKSPRYWYDADAIREPHGDNTHHGLTMDRASQFKKASQIGGHGKGAPTIELNPAGRNKRSVWTVATQPYPGAHFATFPPKLIEPCILAGCPERACSVCGAPWTRIVERERGDSERMSDRSGLPVWTRAHRR
jgi:DNA modification methylase